MILYEFSYWKQPFLYMPFIVLLIMLLFRTIVKLAARFLCWMDGKEYEGRKRQNLIDNYFLEIVIFLLLAIPSSLFLRDYLNVANAYKNGTYKTV